MKQLEYFLADEAATVSAQCVPSNLSTWHQVARVSVTTAPRV